MKWVNWQCDITLKGQSSFGQKSLRYSSLSMNRRVKTKDLFQGQIISSLLARKPWKYPQWEPCLKRGFTFINSS